MREMVIQIEYKTLGKEKTNNLRLKCLFVCLFVSLFELFVCCANRVNIKQICAFIAFPSVLIEGETE